MVLERGVERTAKQLRDPRARAVRFVLTVGIMSFFADFTYESSRAIVGPYFALLGASATAVAVITGFGELLGYGFRLVSGKLSDRTRQFWPITIFGYVVQMASVPLLALAPSWQLAGVLVVLERLGRATRNPPRDVMLSHAAKEMGYGWAFGVHEALDQLGALFGPLAIAVVLAVRHEYRLAFALLAIPAAIMLLLLGYARRTYPAPEDLPGPGAEVKTGGLPRVFWIYLFGALLVAAGFADYPFMAFHLETRRVLPQAWIPVYYAVGMGASGLGSLVFGRIFDRVGLVVLLPLTVVTSLFAPLVFLGNAWMALLGVALWGVGMGVHESLIPAAVAPMTSIEHRASAYGLFTAGYGIFWFLGSVLIGLLYERSRIAVVVFCVLAEVAALPFFLAASRRLPRPRTA